MPETTMDTAQQLAEKVAALIFSDGEVPSEAIPDIALAVIASVPCLKSATPKQTQFIFDSLVGALAARGFARVTIKTAHYIA